MKLLPILILTSVFLVSCGDKQGAAKRSDSKPETLVEEYSESEMDKAIAKAQASIGAFRKALAQNDADSYSVKAPISDENGTEHFWLTDVSFNDGKFSGRVGNEPGIVQNVQFGQPWVVEESEISDWMYTKSEMIYGGYTIEPLLDSYPKEQAEALRAKLVR